SQKIKTKPNQKNNANREELNEVLINDTTDLIETDHAPHAADEKAQGMLKAPFGIVGLETAFPLLYTHLVKTDKMTLQQLVERMTMKPAEVSGLQYGELQEDANADLTLIDVDR